MHGIDLVALQLAIAEGQPLPDRPPAAAGHAIEARLYAEDPAEGFRPAGGSVHALAVPGVDSAFGLPSGLGGQESWPGRSCGSTPGSSRARSSPPTTTPMLAKVIAWAPTPRRRRQTTCRRAGGNADRRPGHQPRPAGRRAARSLVHRRRADTSLLDGYDFAALVPAESACRVSAAAAAVAVAAANRRDAGAVATLPGGWRNVVSQPQLTSFSGPRGRIDVRYHWTRSGITIADADADAGPAVVAFAPEQVTLEVAGVRYRFEVTRAGDAIWVDSALGSVRLALLDRLPAPEPVTESGSLIAPMPGSVTRIAAGPGDRVLAGQLVLVLEAMKMEHQIVAPASGVLAELRVGSGAQVNAGDVLAIVTAEEPEETRER